MSTNSLQTMDIQADKVIAGWSFGSLVANLLPPPFDSIAVASVFAKMGYELSKVYEINVTAKELKQIGKAIAKGISAAAAAAFVGTSVFKWIPGVNIWVALLIQPPIVAAVSYSAGKTFKEYYHFKISKGADLSHDQLIEIAEKALKERAGK